MLLYLVIRNILYLSETRIIFIAILMQALLTFETMSSSFSYDGGNAHTLFLFADAIVCLFVCS